MGNTSKVDPNGYQRTMQKNYAFAKEIFDLISSWLNVLSEDSEKLHRFEFKILQKELEETRKIVKETELLISDPEVKNIIRDLVNERRKGSNYSSA